MTFIRELQRISIDETNSVYHIKIKDKKSFDQWLEQIAMHRNYRQKILEQQSPLLKQLSDNEDTKTDKTNEETDAAFHRGIQSNDRLFYNGTCSTWSRLRNDSSFSKLDFADIQVQLSGLSDILEQIKTNATTTTTTTASVSSRSNVNICTDCFAVDHRFILPGW